MADQMVLATQNWLNKTYGNDPRYNAVEANGQTGWSTIYALTRALQIELGIQNTADSFGPTTQQLYNQNPLSRQDGVRSNKFAILQGALWCKGYSTGHYAVYDPLDILHNTPLISDVFDASVENAVIQLKTDAGMIGPNGIVTVNFMKALLSMDAFKLLSSYGGKAEIRTFQQLMNRKYEAYIGIMPCDGVYGRGTNTAAIYAIQAEEGLPVGVANGNFGPTTKNCCPSIPYKNIEKNYSGQTYSAAKISTFTEILKFGLFVNGFGNGTFDGDFTLDTETLLSQFQDKYAIDHTGTASIGTWLSLFTSSGDTSRSAKAFDCATILTSAKAQTLKNAGYEIGGRYLTGTIGGGISKALTKDEINIIFNAGLRFFPIYQTSARSETYFTAWQGVEDGIAAVTAAYKLGIPSNTIIYFAVDFDAMDYQITNNIIPYFVSVFNAVTTSSIRRYRVGIYGARNVCSRVCNAGYATSSFVGDMSTGFSGNLGFTIPNNWAFDQFATVTIGSGNGQIEIDKDGYSGRDIGVSQTEALSISEAAYSAGVRSGEKEGVYYFDYTIPLDNLFSAAKKQAEDHRCMSWEQYCTWLYEISPILQPSFSEFKGMQLGSFTWFYTHVNHNAVWDIKREARWKEALPDVPYLGVSADKFLYRGELYTSEDMGNLMYGFVGRACGFSDVTLYWGGGVAAQGGMNNDKVTDPDQYYGDDKNDHFKIEFGFHLFEAEYPSYPEVGFEGIPIEPGLLAALADLILNTHS